MSTSGFSSDQYELLDCGSGRKLERFSSWIVDRPAPAAEHQQPQDPQRWKSANFIFQRGRDGSGRWETKGDVPRPLSRDSGSKMVPWVIDFRGRFKLRLEASPAGQLGVFPEQAGNWDWIDRQVRRGGKALGNPLRVLNLFGYTGASTLAAAAAGAEVTHIDSAGNIIQRARENARMSGLEAAPIRWIQEDVTLFCKREVKRGNSYHAVILDPHSYGHGPGNQVWKINQHLGPLLKNCGLLTKSHRAFLLLTSHSPGFAAADLEAVFADRIFGHCGAAGQSGKMQLQGTSGVKLDAGYLIRFP